MKPKITCTLLLLAGLTVISCREIEVDNVTETARNYKIMSSRIVSDSVHYFDEESGDPPKTGVNWRGSNK